MREQEPIELALPQVTDDQSHVTAPVPEEHSPTKTMMETYGFYQQGLSIEEIARQRNCTTGTVEGHLINCISEGYAIDTTQFVSDANRVLIEAAINDHGTAKLKPLHDSLPETISYNMIRVVVAEHLRSQKVAE